MVRFSDLDPVVMVAVVVVVVEDIQVVEAAGKINDKGVAFIANI